MLIDLHAHTSGISRCCRSGASEILKTAAEAGVDGIVLTNHYQKAYIVDGNVDALIEKYIEEFYLTEKIGKELGLKVFFGIEATMSFWTDVHMLIYGVDTDFLIKHPLVFDYTHEELYAVVKANNGALVQAHPFRNGTTVLNTDFLDGIEINCHPIYKNSYSQEIIKIAAENNMAVTCGGDFHDDTYRPICGVYLPEDIADGFQIGEYIINSNRFDLCVHEPNSYTYTKLTYLRNS